MVADSCEARRDRSWAGGSRERRRPYGCSPFLIAVFDGLAIQSRIAPEDTPTGDELVNALVAARTAAVEQAEGD
jgi:hypothetical protein